MRGSRIRATSRVRKGFVTDDFSMTSLQYELFRWGFEQVISDSTDTQDGSPARPVFRQGLSSFSGSCLSDSSLLCSVTQTSEWPFRSRVDFVSSPHRTVPNARPSRSSTSRTLSDPSANVVWKLSNHFPASEPSSPHSTFPATTSLQ